MGKGRIHVDQIEFPPADTHVFLGRHHFKTDFFFNKGSMFLSITGFFFDNPFHISTIRLSTAAGSLYSDASGTGKQIKE